MTRTEILDQQKRDRNSRIKKYFQSVKPTTQILEPESFVGLVADMLDISNDESRKLISEYEVTVNGDLQTDTEYILQSGDVVRAYTGHFLNNPKYICIIK